MPRPSRAEGIKLTPDLAEGLGECDRRRQDWTTSSEPPKYEDGTQSSRRSQEDVLRSTTRDLPDGPAY